MKIIKLSEEKLKRKKKQRSSTELHEVLPILKLFKDKKTELEFSMKESDYQTALRKEMEKIRKEGKITDRYEIIREAKMRIKK